MNESDGVLPGDLPDHLAKQLYDELREMADRYMRRERRNHTLQPTALVHEAYLRIVKQRNLRSVDHRQFLAAAANIMRRVLINHASSRQQRERLRTELDVSSEDGRSAIQVDLIALDDALRRLQSEDERKAKLVELRFFGGLSLDAAAELLGVSSRTANRDWKFARAWLAKEIDKGHQRGH